jgi:ubiquinone/menaquinone biosynthesis C-methylase UbiE
MTTDLQDKQPSRRAAKAYKGPAMEGMIATWYAKVRKPDEELATVVQQVREMLPAGSYILEVAPGPGDLAIELARLGYHVSGLDISRSFVEMAQARARQARVDAEFLHGNASDMPLEANRFDFIVCRAAFKNFSEPVEAIREMYRVLKPGGKALIIDLRGDASLEEINAMVDAMGLNRINAFMTRWTFKHFLLKNAYTKEQIQAFAAQTHFGDCEIHTDLVGMQIWLEKRF